MTSESIKNWRSGIINTRTARVYTPIDGEESIKAEALVKKSCLRCGKVKPHSSYRLVYDKDSEGVRKGIWRNNNCKICESKNANPRDNMSCLREEIESLKNRLDAKDRELKAMQEAFDKNLAVVGRSLDDIAAHGGYIIDSETGVVSLKRASKSS